MKRKIATRFVAGFVSVFLCFNAFASNPTNTGNAYPVFNGAQYVPGKIVFKVRPEFRTACAPAAILESRMKAALDGIGANKVAKKFPRSTQPVSAISRSGRPSVDLSLIYQAEFNSSLDIRKAINLLMSTGMVQYAEPIYIQKMLFTPNDPSISLQTHLTKINAFNAWNVSQGDTNVVIGIVDSGTDWDHPDLASNIKYNYNDPIDGIDNDGDGYLDNYRGWDVSENDNDPMVVNSDHGSHVSGCADAVTNNSTGVAGPGFNCKFLPVKVALDASTTTIDNGYDGIIYAADHGANIINCSWGRSGGPSTFEQDIINHATNDQDVLVVCAAGNDGLDEDYFPASYKNVTSVAATTSGDNKASFSNYGYNIDVCAPGVNIYSTVFDNSYTGMSGTSMASPVAAGCAAMIKAKFPSYNALQVGKQLRNTCDNIYGVSGNTAYQNKLGKGRVNLFKAITDSISPGVQVDSIASTDNNDNVFVAGDTLSLTALFNNLLHATSNLICNLTSTNANVQVLANSFNPGVIASMDTASNFLNPYRVYIKPTAPTNTEVLFKITMTDGTWSDFYYFKLTVNVDYINIAINDVATSITSKGMIGYNQTGQAQGIGFTYQNGPTLLYEMGLMIGANGTQVSDNVRSDGATYDSDFQSSQTVVGTEPGIHSDFDAIGMFRDNGSTSAAPMDLFVTHHAYAWTNTGDRNYIMVTYTIRNGGASALNGLYAGIFSDWDIPAFADNKCSVDNARKMGYAWSTDAGGFYAGVRVLSSNGGFNQYAIDNVTGGGGGADLSDGFSNAEKYQTMSTFRSDAGNTAVAGNDVIDVVSTGPFNLNAGDSVSVAFALLAGQDLSSLQDGGDNAQIRYNNIILGTELPLHSSVYELSPVNPNPASGQLSLTFAIPTAGQTSLEIYSVDGRLVKQVLNEKLSEGKYTSMTNISNLENGAYFIRFNSGSFSKTDPFVVAH